MLSFSPHDKEWESGRSSLTICLTDAQKSYGIGRVGSLTWSYLTRCFLAHWLGGNLPSAVLKCSVLNRKFEVKLEQQISRQLPLKR